MKLFFHKAITLVCFEFKKEICEERQIELLPYTHPLKKMHIPAIAYFINTLEIQSSGRGMGGPNYFKVGDLFWKICTSFYANFRKKNLIRYVLWKVSNFALIFYVIRTLHKKSKQSLRPSTGRIGWDFFSKIGIEWGTYFLKRPPTLK